MVIEIEQAKLQFENLLARLAAGEEVLLLQNGVSFARITPQKNPRLTPMRISGLDRGKVRMADDFDAPLPDEIQQFFEP